MVTVTTTLPRSTTNEPDPADITYGECALGRIRTCDTRFRKPMLYPLSYEGGIAQQ